MGQVKLHEGVVSTLQPITFNMALGFPLEPFCYFKLTFPESLEIDVAQI